MSEVPNILGGSNARSIYSWPWEFEKKEQPTENLFLDPEVREREVVGIFNRAIEGHPERLKMTGGTFARYMPGVLEALKKLAEQTGVKLTDPSGNPRSMIAILQDVPPSQLNQWLNSLPQEVRVGVLGIIAGVYVGTTGENSELRKLLESFGLKVRVIGNGREGVTVTVAPQPGKGPQVAAQLKIKLGENGRIEISGHSNILQGQFGAGFLFGLKKEGGLEIQSRVVGSIDPNNNHQASLTLGTSVRARITPRTQLKFDGELNLDPGGDSVGGSFEVRRPNYAIEGRVTCKEQECIGALKGIVNF